MIPRHTCSCATKTFQQHAFGGFEIKSHGKTEETFGSPVEKVVLPSVLQQNLNIKSFCLILLKN